MDRSAHLAAPDFQTGTPLAIDVAMVGARLHYGLRSTLERIGLLRVFYTDIYCGNKPLLRLLLRLPTPRWLHRRLARRDCAHLDPRRVCSFDWLGLRTLLKERRPRGRAARQAHYRRAGQAFARRVAARLRPGADAIYAFTGVAEEIFVAAHALGIRCLLEQSSAPALLHVPLMEEEARRWPGWERADQTGATKLAARLEGEREAVEWALADAIFCPSSFVLESLRGQGVAANKLRLLSYGIDRDRFPPPVTRARSGGPMRLLFVGTIGLQKGIQYLDAALRLLDTEAIKCRAVGPINLTPWGREQIRDRIELTGPLDSAGVAAAYRWADVLVLPSLCEGSAVVVYEAMAAGLPVIVTPNCGAVARDRRDGLIVPIRDPHALAAALESLAADSKTRCAMGQSARQWSEHFSLERYRAALLESVGELLRKPCEPM